MRSPRSWGALVAILVAVGLLAFFVGCDPRPARANDDPCYGGWPGGDRRYCLTPGDPSIFVWSIQIQGETFYHVCGLAPRAADIYLLPVWTSSVYRTDRVAIGIEALRFPAASNCEDYRVSVASDTMRPDLWRAVRYYFPLDPEE